MRILLLTEYLPASDDGEITGGVEAYCHYVGQHLAREHEVVLIGRRTDGSIWDDASLRSLPGRLLFLARALLTGLRDPGDVVVGTTYVVHPIAWLVAKLRRRPVVFWYPDVLIGTWRGGQFGRVAGIVGETVERILLRLPVDRFIAISESTKAKLVAAGVPSDRIVVIPCGFEPSLVQEVAGSTSEHPARVTVVGRLVPYKRVDVVVRAVARVCETHPDVELVVVGQGPERVRLEALARQLGIGHRVHLRGFVDRHDDVLGAIAESSVFVSASEIEGFGIVVVEAMALGVPYAVTDIPAFREVTSGGVGGRLFPAGDDAALAERLGELLTPGPERAALRAAGRDHAAAYAWSAVASDTAEALATLVPHRTERRP
jgi:glycosyltransferase involved in cell wall biosynthesis